MKLPHSDECERAVLGAALLAPEKVRYIVSRLRPDDFYAKRHQLVFDAIVEVNRDGSVVDLRTIQALLEQRGQFDGIGGIGYLGGLDLDLPNVHRIDDYIDIIKDRRARRDVVATAMEISKLATDTGVAAGKVIAKGVLDLRESERRMSDRSRSNEDAQKSLDEIEELAVSGSKRVVGIPTGLPVLDQVTLGFQRGQLGVLAAAPGCGKSALAAAMLDDAEVAGFGGAVASLEMTSREWNIRRVSRRLQINSRSLQRGMLSTSERKVVLSCVNQLRAGRLAINSRFAHFDDILAFARREKMDAGLDILAVDHLHIIPRPGRNETAELSVFTRELKLLAMDLDIHVLLLAQMNRDSRRQENREPELTDLRGSGSIEQDANLVTFIWEDNDGQWWLLVKKNRDGETGRVAVNFNKPTVTFTER